MAMAETSESEIVIPRVSDFWQPPKRHGRSARRFETAPFVAWDGEGYNRDAAADDVTPEHIFDLLLWSDGKRHGSITRPRNGIRTLEALAFFESGYDANPNAIHVIFAGNYDINMLLRDVNKDDLRRFWEGERIAVGPYRIEFIPRKWFRIDKVGPHPWDERGRFTYEKRMVLWDVHGYFQSSFLVALKRYFGDDYKRLALIEWGKGERQAFTPHQMKERRRYCLEECKALVELMNKLRAHLKRLGLAVQRWDGAGSIASALLRKHRIRDHQIRTVPRDLFEGIWKAYFGGRIEQVMFGHYTGAVYCYDINSAYPHAITKLPSFRRGRWSRQRESSFGLHHVQWKFEESPDRLYPFPFRSRSGHILFPPEGQGWYWQPEVIAAKAALASGYLKGSLTILDSVWWDGDEYPFPFVEGLYEERKKLIRQGDGAEKALKLGLNSMYGKMAQQVGGRDGKPPTSQQMEWAGYVTSFCRGRMFTAATQVPGAVIQLTTDGIYTTQPLELKCSERLGDWDFRVGKDMVSIQSGIYRLQFDNLYEECFRGFGRSAIDFEAIMRMWQSMDAPNWDETLPVAVTRFITLGSALASEKLWADWRRWRVVIRNLEIVPREKRIAYDLSWKDHNPATGLMQTMAREADDYVYLGEESSTYKYGFEEYWDGVLTKEVEQEITSDAD